MTPELERNIRFVGKLLKQTMVGVMKWRRTEGRYETATGEMELRLYKRGANTITSALVGALLLNTGEGIAEETVLEIRDPTTDDTTTLRYSELFKGMEILRDLYNVVRQNTSSVDRKIDAFLREDVTHAQ